MIKTKQPYQAPPPIFKPGDRVEFEGQTYTVTAGTHTHAQLEGRRYAVVNWQLKLVYRARKSKKSHQPKDRENSEK